MAKIINQLKEEIKNVKLIGKMYKPVDNQGFADKWGEWFANDWFSTLEKLSTDKQNADSYFGLMKWNPTKPENFEYWIGMLVDLNEKEPDGFESIIIPSSDVVIYYVKGIDGPELYNFCSKCIGKTFEQGYQFECDSDNNNYCFERYNCPRFTNSDENNEVILDFGVLVKNKKQN